MEQKDKQMLLDALVRFDAAARHLNDVWQLQMDKNQDHLQDLLIDDYPSCLPSFDEFVVDVTHWVLKQKEILG